MKLFTQQSSNPLKQKLTVDTNLGIHASQEKHIIDSPITEIFRQLQRLARITRSNHRERDEKGST